MPGCLLISLILIITFYLPAFDLLSSFKKWTGEVEETLDINKNNEHAERFLDEVNDKGLELMKKHEELGKDMWGKHRNRVEKVKKKCVYPTTNVLYGLYF